MTAFGGVRVDDVTVNESGALQPAAVATDSGRTIVGKVDALEVQAGAKASLTPEDALALFARSWALVTEVNEFNSFAGKARPSENLFSDMVEQAENLAPTFEELDAQAGVIFKSPEAMLAGFASEVIQRIKTHPRCVREFMAELNEEAKQYVDEYLTAVQAGYRHDLAGNLTSEDIRERVKTLCPLVVEWLKQETLFQLHIIAASGVSGDKIKDNLQVKRFATSYEVAHTRADRLAHLEQKDSAQDKMLMDKLEPLMDKFTAMLRDPGNRSWFDSDVAEVWKDRIGDWELGMVERRCTGTFTNTRRENP